MNVCIISVSACLVLLGRHVTKRPNVLKTALAMVRVQMACATVNHHFVVLTVIRHFLALTIATQEEFVW